MEHSLENHLLVSHETCGYQNRSDASDANSVDSAFSLDSVTSPNGCLNTTMSSGDTLSHTVLFDELKRVKEDLKQKDDEVRRASELRENVDKEIQDLTASLFESAHLMVEDAKRAQSNTEQKLKVANQTIEALLVENSQLKKTVTELKDIVNSCRSSISSTSRSSNSLSTTPSNSILATSHSISSSNFDQSSIISTSSSSPSVPLSKKLKDKCKQHIRSSSDLQSWSTTNFSNINNDYEQNSDMNDVSNDDKCLNKWFEFCFRCQDNWPLVNNVILREFARWEENPTIERYSSAFMHRVYNEDIGPCLSFPNAELSTRIINAIERNEVIIEAFHPRTPEEAMKVCSLTGDLCQCDYRIRLGEKGDWYPLSHLSRNRIASVCDFFTYIRHVQNGLVKTDTRSRYNKIIELRKQMAYARLGL